MQNIFKYKSGFTLAEVLITLAIIGVVAAMTIPSLVQKYNERVKVTQLKKVYSVLSNAYNLSVVEYGTPENWGVSVTTDEVDDEGNITVTDYSGMEKMAEILAKYMKVDKWCEVGKICYPYKVMSLDGNSVISTGTTPVKAKTAFYLQDGTYMSMGYINDIDAYGKYADVLACLPVAGDKDRRRGKDCFYFHITAKGILPSGYRGDYTPFNPNCSKLQDKYGFGCTAWVLENENFDYLKCDDLDWGTKTKCD